MSKKYLFIMTGILAAAALSGCGKKEKKETEISTSAAAEENAVLEDTDEAAEVLEPITPADYLVKDVSEYVTPGDLKGLEVTQPIYEVTDDTVQDRILSELEAYGEEIEVDRAAELWDIVMAEMTSTVQGETDSPYTETVYLTLGDEEYGADFDAELIGASAGDTKTFSCSYKEDSPIEEWENKTVDFTVTITSVSELNIPEYNEDFLSKYTDYSSKEDYEASIRDLLMSEYEETSYTETVEALFQAAINASQFSGYPEDLYDMCKEEVLSIYSMFLGDADEQTIYDTFGLAEEDIEAEVLVGINRRLLISAICEANDVKVTEDDYVQFVTEYAEAYDYESPVQFEADNTRAALVWAMYENEAAAILYNDAEITTMPFDPSQEYADEDDAAEDTEQTEEEFSLDEESTEKPE